MSSMRPPVTLVRTGRRCLSTRGPRGPRSILDKSRTPSRFPDRYSKASSLPSNRHQSSHQEKPLNKDNGIPQQPQRPAEESSKVALVSSALAENESSDLVAPVRIPDDPEGVLTPSHAAWDLLNNSSLVIQRQIEMMNVFLGLEQANRYVIMSAKGETIGYMAEQAHGMGSVLARQAFRTHRSFTCHIFDKTEREVLRIHRPFSWVSSRIRVYDACSSNDNHTASNALDGTSINSALNQPTAAQISPLPLSEMRIIGETIQQWAPLRRKYNLFNYRSLTPPNDSTPKLGSGDLPNTDSKAVTIASTPDQATEAGMTRFAQINEAFMSWDFTLRDAQDNVIGSVNRNFGGFAREIFTDTGVYALRMDSAALTQGQETTEQMAMTLDQRAVMLATAVCVDFDYFSRHSGVGGGWFMPMWFPMGMGGAAEGGAAGGAVGGAAGEIGAAEGAAGGIAGGAARGATGAGEGAIAGAGTMAGYEAMQRGRGQEQQQQQQNSEIDDASPTANEPFEQQGAPGESAWGEQNPWGQEGQQDPWAQQNDPWGQDNSGGSSGGSSGGGEGGGGGFDWGDWF